MRLIKAKLTNKINDKEYDKHLALEFIRNNINSELVAIHDYEQAIIRLENNEIKSRMIEIKNDEQTHLNQLIELYNKYK